MRITKQKPTIWLMLATLLLSNAIVAWHSGAHYFENQANTDYSQFQQPADTKLQATASVQASQKAPASTTQIHTELCDIGVLAQGFATAVTGSFNLPTLAAPSFWLRLHKPALAVARLIFSRDARAPPIALS